MNVLTRVANSLSSFVVKAADRGYACYHMRYDVNGRTFKHVARCELLVSWRVLLHLANVGDTLRCMWSHDGDAGT